MTTPAAPKEELVWKGSPSQVLNLGWHLLAALAAVVLLGLGLAVTPLLLLLLVLPAGFSFWHWLSVTSRLYEITSQRVKVTQGIFSRRTDELELYRVRDTTVIQSFLHRLFGKGNLVLNTNDATTPVVTLECLPAPVSLCDQLREHIEACRDRKRARVAELSGADPDLEQTP